MQGTGQKQEEDFDAVIVAIGNYHEPNLVSAAHCVQLRKG